MSTVLAIVVVLLLLEIGYFVAGRLLMREARGRQRLLVAHLLALFGVLEGARYLANTVLPFGLPFVFAIGVVGSLWGHFRSLTIGACDKCNWWIPPFGGSIFGASQGSPDLLCLRCTTKKWTLLLPVVLPFGKLRSTWYWISKGLWE